MPPANTMTELRTTNLLRPISKNSRLLCNDSSPEPGLTSQVKHDWDANVKLRISTQRVATVGTFWSPGHPFLALMDIVLQLSCRGSGVFQYLRADSASLFRPLIMGSWRNDRAEWWVSWRALTGGRGMRLVPLLRDLEAERRVRANLASRG